MMIRRGILLLAMAWPLAAAGAAMSPEETVSAADRQEKAGAFQQAIDLYTGFLKNYPDHVQRAAIQYRLALCYDGMGKAEPAIQYLKESVSGPAEKATGKHRPDAYMKLTHLYADANKYQEAADALNALLKEGAGLYEDEAQSLRASYLAMLGQYAEAIVLFNVLCNKPAANIAKDAGYKLVIVLLKAGNVDLAKNAIEGFVQRYPGDARIGELFMRVARAYFDKKQYKSATEICQQVLNDFKDAAEAIEAAFVIALCHRESGNLDKAIETFVRAAHMPQAAHNTVLASEALFESAQIYRKQLKQPDKAAEHYHEAAILSRDPITERQQTILEQSLFWEAETFFQQKKWAAAFDLYARLRTIGSKLNVLERLMYCKSKMNSAGDVSMDMDSEEEVGFIRKRIADNPGTLLALQSEIFLLERAVERAKRNAARPPWSTMGPLAKEFAALLRKYPEDILKQQNQSAYIKLRQATVCLCITEDNAEYADVSHRGVELCEQALAEAPSALFRVEALESLALLANRSGQNAKAFDAYRKLYAITGKDPEVAARRPPSDYLQGIIATADSSTLADEAIKTMDQVIADTGGSSRDAREARFYRAELLYMKQRFTQAAAAFREFVKLYGPPQNPNGSVSGDWKKPAQIDSQTEQVYEAAQRVAHCWRSQGTQSNMVAAYRWVVTNFNHLNPRVAEAWYTILTAGVKPDKLAPTEKENLARQLWTRVVNGSLDPGSKAFRDGYYPWVRDPGAVSYVKAAILKSGEYHGDVGKHRLAGDLFREYTMLFDPKNPNLRQQDGTPSYPLDNQYEIASYASGKEYLLANDYAAMVNQFRVFLDDLRYSRFRIPALTALGHYGTQAEMFPDATAAYAALLDEYGPPNPLDTNGRPVPIAPEKRLRKEGAWNGIRIAPPPKWDSGKMRFGLGHLYWKKEDWPVCQVALTPFLDDPTLRQSASRAEALFMIARCHVRQNLAAKAMKTLETIIRDHGDFKAIEEVYAELARVSLDASERAVTIDTYKRFAAKFPNSDRLPYAELCAAAAQIEEGHAEAGAATLRSLAKANTYEDVKSGAYYHLALLSLRQTKPDTAAAFDLLRKSIECFPESRALLQASKCACDLKNWAAAREYADRVTREFPKAPSWQLREAEQLRRRIAQEAGGAW